MRVAALLGAVLIIIVLVALVYLAVRLAQEKRKVRSLNKLIDALDDPVSLLPEKERIDWARNQIAQREQDRLEQTVRDYNPKGSQ